MKKTKILLVAKDENNEVLKCSIGSKLMGLVLCCFSGNEAQVHSLNFANKETIDDVNYLINNVDTLSKDEINKKLNNLYEIAEHDLYFMIVMNEIINTIKNGKILNKAINNVKNKNYETEKTQD